MEFKVYIQDKFVEIIEAKNVTDVLATVSKKIKNNQILVDNSLEHNIRVEPVNISSENDF